VGLSNAAYGILFGVLCRQAGLSLGEACLMSAVVFAGSSQLVAISMWATPIPILPIVATTLLVNLRHVLMGLTLRPWYSRLSAARAYGSYFFLTDESWALTFEFRRSADGAFMPGAGVFLFVCWVGATALGRVTGTAIRDPSSWGLDFAFVAVFLVLLISLAKGKSDLLPWSLAAAVAVAADRWLPGNWYVLLGAMAGSLRAALRRADA
jgi:4-azaleucine resistance transporter AzlC